MRTIHIAVSSHLHVTFVILAPFCRCGSCMLGLVLSNDKQIKKIKKLRTYSACLQLDRGGKKLTRQEERLAQARSSAGNWNSWNKN